MPIDIPIALRYRTFLTVLVEDTVLQFTVLPFRLNIALRVFTKMEKPMSQALAHPGVKIVTYLDDWLVQSPNH